MVTLSPARAQAADLLDQMTPAQDDADMAPNSVPGYTPLKKIGSKMQTPTVLVVDDEPDVLAALRKRLEFMGFHVLCAGDGPSATSVAFRESPDVIILDVGLPLLDGHGVAERLRYNRRTRYIPVIYLTARTGIQDRATAEENCAFAYITKPFIAAEILTAVNRALDLPGPSYEHGARAE